MSRPPALRVLLVGALLLVAAACGDDDSTTPSSGSPDGPKSDGTGAVEVVAQDIGFDRDRYDADAGKVAIRYVNEGSIYHTFVIEDVGGLELTVRNTGDVDKGAVELDVGEYVVYCDVPGHRQAGMEATLAVS